MAPMDAYVHLRGVLEHVNAVIGELFTAEVLGEDARPKKAATQSDTNIEDEVTFDWSSGLDDADDSELYFSPEAGNVIFASAYDGWAFDIADFANIFSQKLGFNAKVLQKTLWGDFFINMKAKKIVRGAQAKAKKPLFVQLILENIWSLYELAMERKDKDQLMKVIEKLQIKVSPRDLRSTDTRQHVRAIFSQWLSLAPCLLRMVCLKLPSPNHLSEERVLKLICSKTRSFDALTPETKALKPAFLNCSSSDEAPVIAFVSKMVPIQRNQLPKYKAKPLTAEELAARRDRARQRHQQKIAGQDSDEIASEKLEELKITQEEESNTVFIALARVFSGCLKPGREIYVLGPKYDPAIAMEKQKQGEDICDETSSLKNNKYHISKTTLTNFYLLLGRDLEELPEVPAGNLVGIGNLEDHILKSATLCNEISCPAFVELTQSAVPILRVAVEPVISSDLPKLLDGLALLNQADANVQVLLTDKGEHVLVTAGEVHLERCLRDLKETYAGIDVNVSEPIVPFRETIVTPPKTDMVNEELGQDNQVLVADNETSDHDKTVTIQTPNKQCTFKIRAYPLPTNATELLQANTDLLRAILDKELRISLPTTAEEEILALKDKLEKSLDTESDLPSSCVNKIWSFGPKKCGPNILINGITDYDRHSVWEKNSSLSLNKSTLTDFDNSIVSGFQLACTSGPLCEEPLMGVAFVIESCIVMEAKETAEFNTHGPLSGQIVSTVKDGCRKSFQAHAQRLMAAMYSCDIQVKTEVLGKLFASLGKRHGKVVREELLEGTSTFVVTAHLPVVESFQFAQEIRRQTSGLAMPQLVFSHWEVIDVDPFWVPQSEEEILHFGEKADSENQARGYMNDVRKKKGLAIDEKIVEFAEKQRTLTKMK